MHALCQKISLALTFVPSQERLTVKLSSAFEYSDESVPTGRIHIFWIPLLQTPEPNKESWCVYYMQGKEDDPCFVFLVFFLHIRQGFDPVSADLPCMLRFVQRCRSHWRGWVFDRGSKTNFAHARSQRGRNEQMYRKVRPQKTPRTPTQGDESCVCSCLHWCIYFGRTSISSPLPQSDAFYSRCVRMQAPSTGDEVESRLFCTESGDLMRAPAVL